MKRGLTICAATLLSFASFASAQDVPAEYRQVLTTLGKQGDYKANVLKVNIPRNDLSVTVGNVKTPTPFGFGGWVAMTDRRCAGSLAKTSKSIESPARG